MTSLQNMTFSLFSLLGSCSSSTNNPLTNHIFDSSMSVEDVFQTHQTTDRPHLTEIRAALTQETRVSPRFRLIDYVELFADSNTINDYDQLIRQNEIECTSPSSPTKERFLDNALCVSLRMHCRGDVVLRGPLDENQKEICETYLAPSEYHLLNFPKR